MADSFWTQVTLRVSPEALEPIADFLQDWTGNGVTIEPPIEALGPVAHLYAPNLPDRFESVAALEDFMTAPRPELTADLAKLRGDTARGDRLQLLISHLRLLKLWGGQLQ